jgi:lipopolysaccharide export system protein LptA
MKLVSKKLTLYCAQNTRIIKQSLFFHRHETFMILAYSTLGKKFQVIIFFFLFSLGLSAQQRTKVVLQAARTQHTEVKSHVTYLTFPTFLQDNAVLTCDSAVFYTDRNYFEAYRNVHINQADTINIYSDRLDYDGNAKLAHLTSKVRLVDKTSTLTTNILDYNMFTKVGTYVEGGKIKNKDVDIVSKNGYYFANSRDAYFRYNVVVVTEQSTIKSDTLRYNTATNQSYFYGPTNIKEKDGGNLYTENGAYNTKTRYAYFGKKNLYTSGSKSLKGDSLYYDGIAGYGKAVRNIVFRDTTDKMVMRGQMGYYYKADQRTVVTRNAYAGMGTNDSIMVNNVKTQDTIWIGADTLETQMVRQKLLKLIKGPVIKKDNELGEEERTGSLNGKGTAGEESPGKKRPGANPSGGKKPAVAKPVADRKKTKDELKAAAPPARDSLQNNNLRKDSLNLKLPDSLRRRSLPLSKADSLSRLPDSLSKNVAVISKNADSALKTISAAAAKDSLKIRAGASANAVKPAVKKTAKTTGNAAILQAGAKKPLLQDSLSVNPADTVLTRVIKAFHNVKVFKTDMQAKADSLFYTSADSTLRWFKNPIIWSQGSQQTGDTIYLQLRNKKINSVQVIQNAFSVNVEKDSLKFNQIKGKILTGFFKEGNLNSLYVDGNAESVYFTKTEDGKKYDKMNQTISSRLKITFKNSEIADVVPIKNVEGATTPVADLKGETILTGFIWKPELRPLSKRDITNPKVPAKPKAQPAVKTPAKTTKAGLSPAILKTGGKNIPAAVGAAKQLIKSADSLNLQKKIPAGVTDSAKKARPGIL